MNDIQTLSDALILRKIGEKLKAVRLKQNVTQASLASAADISLSSVKKIENGDIKSFDSFLRVIRILGKLDALQPLIEEETLSPNEYYELMRLSKKKQRKRAVGTQKISNKEKSEW